MLWELSTHFYRNIEAFRKKIKYHSINSMASNYLMNDPFAEEVASPIKKVPSPVPAAPVAPAVPVAAINASKPSIASAVSQSIPASAIKKSKPSGIVRQSAVSQPIAAVSQSIPASAMKKSKPSSIVRQSAVSQPIAPVSQPIAPVSQPIVSAMKKSKPIGIVRQSAVNQSVPAKKKSKPTRVRFAESVSVPSVPLVSKEESEDPEEEIVNEDLDENELEQSSDKDEIMRRQLAEFEEEMSDQEEEEEEEEETEEVKKLRRQLAELEAENNSLRSQSNNEVEEQEEEEEEQEEEEQEEEEQEEQEEEEQEEQEEQEEEEQEEEEQEEEEEEEEETEEVKKLRRQLAELEAENNSLRSQSNNEEEEEETEEMKKIRRELAELEAENNSLHSNNEEDEKEDFPSEFQCAVDEQIIQLWEETIDFKKRDTILAELQRRKLFPCSSMTKWEYETGAYPDIIDPEFLQKLLAKREFAESLQTTWKPRTDPCEDNSTFEVTPVQRFVTNFMSAKTPYMSALLFHGVGVGKTCAAVQIIEAWLEYYPRNEIYLVAPRTIQAGFFRTIFDPSKVIIGEGNEPNSASQCTGDTYMKLTNTLYERDIERINRSVNKAIKRRYKVFGYNSFSNFIRDELKKIPVVMTLTRKEEVKKEIIRKIFSGKLLIVDEAHNLRDLTEESDTVEDALAGGKSERSEAADGKALTPFLRDILRYSEGMKFCALTATPMYNSYREIIFILNLLLMNDKQATLTEADIFDKQGNITETGAKKLSYTSQRYVSFMRGENPTSFPIRLFANGIPAMPAYPTMDPRGTFIEKTTYYKRLPLIPIMLHSDTLKATIAVTGRLPQGGKGLNTIMLDKLVHAGNIIFPVTEYTKGDNYDAYVSRIDRDAILTVFDKESAKESSGGESSYRVKHSVDPNWLTVGPLAQYSPKFNFFIERIRQSEGCIFAYTRFVPGGAIPLALALEANGYTAYGRKTGLLRNGVIAPGGKQCALCPRKEKEHQGANHAFAPAYYGILTGEPSISPNNEKTIKAQRAIENATGIQMKVIIGSQIASEGVDLRFVRETHIIDSWFHLNKTEQILGRAIRYLSHCALSKEKRNNTVYLYTAVLPASEYPRETADLYSYRLGFKKAELIGKVTRIMKQSALDCNLNHDAIIIKGQNSVLQIDSQRQTREEVDINDMPFTAVCDWIETCDYRCNPDINLKALKMDDSTYDEFSARWRVQRMKETIRALFRDQAFHPSERLWDAFVDIPRLAAVDLLNDIVNNKTFQVQHGSQSGYIRYCNDYYIFQPNVYADLTIPLAIRIASFPVKRDVYTPIEYEIPEVVEEIHDEQSVESVGVFWEAVKRWTEHLSTSVKYAKPPGEIDQHRIAISHDDLELLEFYRQTIEMIEWFHKSFQASAQKNPESFRKTVLFYLWDEWLTLEEKKFLVYYSDIDVQECVRDHQYQIGRILVNRFMDPKTGQLQYLCEKGTQCMESITDAVIANLDEPIKSFSLNVRTTGSIYGIIVPKNGEIVFKTDTPPEVGRKIGKGKECGNVSGAENRLISLIHIGDILKQHGKTDFQLNRVILTSSRKVAGPTRNCTLLDLCLRFLDNEQIEGKKWFFRSVEAYYIGYRGLFRSGRK